LQNSVLLMLVVEDDSLIQDIVQDALEEGGLKTDIAASGEEAVTLIQGEKDRYRALVTDVHLKG
jgi:CheY-like chemotaxis protein